MEQRISVGETAHRKRGVGFFKSEARYFTVRSDNLAKLIFAFLTVGIFAAFFIYIHDAVCSAPYLGIFSLGVDSYNMLVKSLGYIVALLGTYTVFGLLCGYWVMCLDICTTGRGKLGKLLYVFESARRMRACLAGYLLTALSAVPGVILFAAVYSAKIQHTVLRYALLSASVFVGAVIFLALIFLMMAYPVCEGKSISKRLKKSLCMMKNHIFSLIVLTLSFIPLIIISVLSFGILFIIYTLPYICLSFASAVCWAKDVERYGVTGGQDGKQG